MSILFSLEFNCQARPCAVILDTDPNITAQGSRKPGEVKAMHEKNLKSLLICSLKL